MKRIKNWFQGLKLNNKFTIICLIFVTIPMIVLAGWMFWNIEDNLINEKLSAMKFKLDMAYAQVIKNVDTINMSTQFFLSDQGLKDFLSAEKRGDNYTTEALLDFYNRDVASLERMVNNNTYLYQIRVYVDSDGMQEMMPILYRRERMQRLSFWQEDFSYGWKYGYKDNLFSSYGQLTGEREILSLLTSMEDYGLGEIGVLEVAMYMDTMFPVIYESSETLWGSFADGDGNLHFAQGIDTEFNQKLIRTILKDNQNIKDDMHVYFYKTQGRQLVIGYQPLRELNGILVYVDDIESDLTKIRNQRYVFVLCGILVIVLLAVLVNKVAKGMLKQFYSILRSIRKVQKGDLDLVIENCGSNEMGELGDQINKMLYNIKQLTTDNLNHELLVKNTEIRALQNQINAHFIYNVLESIKMMAEIKEDYDISDAITSLGKLLRYSMKWVPGNVTVEEELEYIRNYLSLINLRFDYEIYLSVNIPQVILKQRIPKMSLQPIVENAIYHGIEQMAEDTNIYMKGIEDKEDCIIEITDAGRGMSEEEVENLYKRISGEVEVSGGAGNGIGLKNVQDRIKINFGEKYGIEIASKLGCYTKIMVRIPMNKEGSV
ncbi:MAG: histidine kinase [Lachnospiraceae bacterium]|jgi:two-component system sensor histidine kinase YesM|nr:histidine kinase [Lachnospiraceae bacterium]